MELEEKLSLQRGEIETVRRKLQKAENDNVDLQETLVSVTEKLSVEKSFIQEKMQKQMDSFKTQLEFQIQESSALLRKKSTISITNEYDKPSPTVNIVPQDSQPKATSTLSKKRKTDISLVDDFPVVENSSFISNKSAASKSFIDEPSQIVEENTPDLSCRPKISFNDPKITQIKDFLIVLKKKHGKCN
ncbi:hypothetical protein AYI69_g1258 [Smittium culicis]|uniref:Uncharacterized protein n=1 Tax=Smittium culicis TaxID=133412 RepID=A0A1R1YQS8_9FUNG|nr:hypothetical protein AYI69_g1258 [Smittium culicis]